jgi:hypothetical protein
MAPVLITCPATHELIPAGIDVRQLDELADRNLLVACPECGHDHEWTPEDAVLSAWGGHD